MKMLYKVMSVVGTRPNFMKTAPVVREIERRKDRFTHVLVHTAQHYDDVMWHVFVEDLELPEPLYYLGVGSGTHAEQVARTIERLESVIATEQPDVVLVPGDVNSTLGSALGAAIQFVPIGHIESGLRSFDPTMAEELNRKLVDQLSRFLFVHSPEAHDNLVREGCNPAWIHYVGNTMIDTLLALKQRIEAFDAPATHGVSSGEYVLVTLHRPALVDSPPLLAETMDRLNQLAEEFVVLFAVHPRTQATLSRLGLAPRNEDFRLLEPLRYVEFLSLLASAAAVLTDSGGIQEEATFLGIPCFTLRANTERPVTCTVGSNTLLGLAPERIAEIPALIEKTRCKPSGIPALWDGQASARIVEVLDRELDQIERPVSAARNAVSVTPIVSSGSGEGAST